MATPATGALFPLCVDLDGTLIATDLLWESLFAMIRKRPMDLVRLPFWLLGGRANLKRRIAERVVLDPGTLPYRAEVIGFLEEEKARGRRLVLATAADRRLARCDREAGAAHIHRALHRG